MKIATVKSMIVLGIIFLMVNKGYSCVGRILYIGILQTMEQELIAENLSLLVNERTGTTVKIRYFKDNNELYSALKISDEEKRADIIVENTNNALSLLGKPRSNELKGDYLLVKELYEKEYDLIWLYPFSFNNNGQEGQQSLSAPLVRRDVIGSFPLLPRVLKKLASAIDEEAYGNLLTEAKSGKKIKNVARDFLRAKKLI